MSSKIVVYVDKSEFLRRYVWDNSESFMLRVQTVICKTQVQHYNFDDIVCIVTNDELDQIKKAVGQQFYQFHRIHKGARPYFASQGADWIQYFGMYFITQGE